MMGVIEVVFVAGLLCLGMAAFAGGVRTLGPYRRLRRVPTRPVVELALGPAEAAGTLHAVESPLTTIEGGAAVALKSRFTVSHKESDGEAARDEDALVLDEFAGRVEVRDASGRCTVEMDHVVLMGPELEAVFTAEALRERFPAWWARLAETYKFDAVTGVSVKQTFVPEGAAAFVSGEGAPDDRMDAGDGYRAAKQRVRMRGREARPLVLSAWGEDEVTRYLRRPSLVLFWIAGLCVASACALWAMMASLSSMVG